MRYNTDSCTVEMSAEELCMLALRHGDLDAPPVYIQSLEEDGQLYYRLQAEAGAYYNPHVSLCNTTERGGIYYTVETFADGIIRREGGSVVDKLKAVKGRGAQFPPDEMTVALLKCSAYFLGIKEDLPYICGRVTYVEKGAKKFKHFDYRFARMELAGFYNSLLDKIAFRARLAREKAVEELPSAESAVFPYTTNCLFLLEY